MEERELEGVVAEEQLAALERRALDTRAAVTTGWPGIDDKLYRGGFLPGQFVCLAGRMYTRKTAVAMNLAANFLAQGVPVGFLTLDESLEMYVSKFMSVFSRRSSEWLETHWQDPTVQKVRELYAGRAANLTMSSGIRPNFEQLTRWLEMTDVEVRPRVVFIDYISLLVHYRKSETQRVVGLFEELQTWTKNADVITIALHQAGRTDEGVSKKYHGDTPMTAEGMLYGGEQQIDVLLSTYRPALNQLGQMGRDQAEMILGKDFDEEKWVDARLRAKRYERSTMLQLLKNRPSTKGTNFEGIELVSPDDSQFLQEMGDGVSDAAEREEVA